MKKTIAIIMMALMLGCTMPETEGASKTVLGNGIRLILKDNPNTGLVAIDYMIKRSPKNDENHALDNFVHRMLLAGTETRSRDEIIEQLEDAGASIKASTYNEFSHIVIIVPSNRFSTALEILSDILHNPSFTEEEIEKEREAILQEMEAKYDQPEVVAEELLMKTLYKGHPFQHPPDGYPEEVRTITREQLLERYNNRYTGSNMVIGIAGNIKKTSTKDAINKLFSDIEKGKPLMPIPDIIVEDTRNAEENFLAQSFFINEGYLTVPATHPDYMKTRVLGGILGVGSGSRLFYELREKKGLAYTIYIITPSVRNTGFMKIAAIVREDAVNDTITGIQDQIERIQTEKISEQELTHVKNKMEGFFILDHQRSEDQANYLAFYEMQGLGYEHDSRYIPEIRATTAEEIQRVANEYLNNPTVTVVGPFEEAIR